MEPRLIWINLLVKLGVAAAVSSSLVRSKEFKSLLFREERTLRQKIYLVLWFGVPITIGVWIRFSAKSFLAGDLSFETVLLLGVIGGRWAGILGGVLMALPALVHGEWATLPFGMLCGFIAGQLRTMALDKDDIWSFSPFIDLSIYRLIRRNLPTPAPVRLADHVLHHDRRAAFRAKPVGATTFLIPFSAWTAAICGLRRRFMRRRRWPLGSNSRSSTACASRSNWKSRSACCLHARMEALQNQINPHFLFNTLNSISSLVRFDPDKARDVISKLATILRRLLNSTDSFVPLREEVEFIDNYLDIEVVRFGPDKLRVVKELDPASLDVMVPSMLLQPLVENSIKHGLSSTGGRRQHLPAQPLSPIPGWSSRWKTMAWAWRRRRWWNRPAVSRRRHRHGQYFGAAAGAVRRYCAHDHR